MVMVIVFVLGLGAMIGEYFYEGKIGIITAVSFVLILGSIVAHMTRRLEYRMPLIVRKELRNILRDRVKGKNGYKHKRKWK